MTKKLVSILFSILLILSPLCFSPISVNATVAFGSTTITLQPIADAYVDNSNYSTRTTNYGSSGSLYVTAPTWAFTYVKFDLSSLPPEANIIDATLEMHIFDKRYISPFEANKIGAHYCSYNYWTENGITWNNYPNFNAQPTDDWSCILINVVNYASWNVTADVKQAFPSGILTEVFKFEDKEDYGYVIFGSRETTDGPLLEIEYTTELLTEVHLESSQDTAVTSNLGLTTFEDETFPLPSDIDVVVGTYEVSYGSGYTFTHWETAGGVSVSNPLAATTTVTVTGDGTLRAVGNVSRLEYTYDYDYSILGSSETEGCIDALRFTPLFSDQLLMARFYIHELSSEQDNTFKVHVMDENRNDVITPFEQTPTSEGWFDVNLAAYNIDVTEGTDFYIGLEWLTDNNPELGYYSYNLCDRSWEWDGTDWYESTSHDFLIRAVVGEGEQITEPSIIDHLIVAEETEFHVITESNSTISNCQLNKDNKELLFDVAGTTSSYGFCNVTIPNELLGGPFSIKCDGQTVTEVGSSGNSTHTWLHFVYPQTTNSIEITGTTVIPEFSSAILLTLLMSLAFIASALAKKNVAHKQRLNNK